MFPLADITPPALMEVPTDNWFPRYADAATLVVKPQVAEPLILTFTSDVSHLTDIEFPTLIDSRVETCPPTKQPLITLAEVRTESTIVPATVKVPPKHESDLIEAV
jgi:hypothetical protein